MHSVQAILNLLKPFCEPQTRHTGMQLHIQLLAIQTRPHFDDPGPTSNITDNQFLIPVQIQQFLQPQWSFFDSMHRTFYKEANPDD